MLRSKLDIPLGSKTSKIGDICGKIVSRFAVISPCLSFVLYILAHYGIFPLNVDDRVYKLLTLKSEMIQYQNLDKIIVETIVLSNMVGNCLFRDNFVFDIFWSPNLTELF